jgi:hypothetical protein
MSRVRYLSSHRDADQHLNQFRQVERGVQRPLDERRGRVARHGHGRVGVELYGVDPDR